MKPWERNWENQSEAVSVKPWERNWSQTETEVDVTKIKASDFVGEQGFDNKPFEKLNNYIQKITEVKVNEDVDYSIKDAWEGFKNNLFKFEVRKSNEKPEGAQVLEDTAVEALDVGKQYAEATKKAVVNADIKDLGKGTKEVSKALGRATAEFTIGGVGKVVSMVGDLMYDETDITNMSKFEANKIKGGNFTAETYKKIGRYLQDLSDMAVQSDILKEDPEIFSGSFVENPSLTRLVSFGASAVPSLFTAGGLHKLGVPNKLNGMILAGLESSDVYGEAREAGKGKGEALGLFALSSAGTAYLETKGLDNLFDNKMKSLAGRMLTTMGSEGFTEYWQTVYQNAVKKYGYDATQDLFEGGFEALIGGIIGGGGAQVVNTSFDKFSKRADKYGVTQEEKMAILNAVSNETNAKSEQLNAMFQSNYDKSMKTLEEYINTNKDEAAVAQAVEKKQQLEKIYNDTYNELKNIMPEQEAKSNAALVRNSAFFFAEEFGISPEEFIKKRGVKVVKSDYEQFKGNKTTENMPIMQVTQKDLNYARSHPEWKSNARIIEMIGQAGADINDDINTINKALKQYSIEENKFRKKKEDAQYNLWAKDLDEAKQERYAMMVENGVKPQDAYNAVTYTEDYIPFQGGETKLNMSSALPQNIANKEVNVVRVDDSNIVDERTLRAKIQNLIDNRASQETSDGALLSFINTVWVENKGKQRVAKHIAHSSLSGQQNSRSAAVDDILSLLRESAFVEASEENKGKNDYDKVLRFYVPIQINNGDIYPVRIVALHKKGEQSVKLTGDVYDVILEDKGVIKNQATHTNSAKNKSTSALEGQPDKISIANLLKNVKGIDKTLYRESYNPRKDIPNVRGGWTKNKILKYLKANGSLRGVGTATRMIAEFDSVEEFKEHMFYHGAKYGTSGRMKPSITMSDREVENVGGGGYGDKYWAISLSKSKKVAGNFATASGNGSIYPVLLVKNAKVIEMPELDDSADLEDHIEQLYTDGVDAVWIGDKDSGEQELAVINPKAIVNIGTSEFYRAYKLGQPENPINIRSDEEIQKIYDYAKGFVREYPKTVPDEELSRARSIVYWQEGLKDNVYGATNSNEEPIANPANFNVFIEGSRVTENDEPVSPSNPPKKIYRGDTRYFEEYEEQENAFEYDWGRAFYLSDNYDDILTNYQSGGADLKNRIDREAEQLADEEDIDYDEAREKVRQKYEQEDIVREFYLSIKEPVIVGGDKETFFDYTEEHNEETDEYGELEGKGFELIGAIENYLYDIGADDYVQTIVGTLQQEMFDNGGLTASQVEDTIRGIEEVNYLIDYESGAGELLSSAFGAIGFDGIIDHRAGTKFRNMNMDPDTTHYIVFNSEQAKSVDNKGEWGVRNRNFYLQNGANDPKGAYVNRIIHLFQNADASTLPHELAHFWKDTLKDAAKISKRAAKMLEDVEKWAEQEFNRKYSVQLKDGRYVVNNKQGLTVYDHNFRTEADAKEYAKEELFAQGNEAFLREGVAPNNSLKQAFRNFLNWLKHIYNQARQLDIRLSPEIRQVYADILGGTEIDFFLNTDPDTFVENRIKLATETVKSLDEQIEEAQRMGVTVSEPDGRGLKHVWETAMIPLSTRLGRVSNKLKNRLRRYEFDIANSLNHYYDEARPFLQKWKTFSEMDTIAFDIALKNDYVKKQLEIVDKYGAREEWEKVRKLLLDIFDSAVKAGLDVNFRPDYFPRKVKDVQGFLSYLRGRPEWTKFEEALKDADPDHTFTAEEQADFINKYLRGFIKVDLMPYKYGSEKQRSIEIINNEMNKYYAPSMESLVSYIEGMNARIEASKFLGRDAENLDASVGGYLDYLINNKEIDPNKVDEVKEILKARFNQKGVGNKWIAGARNISYMYTMGGINSAITQIEDLSVSMYKAGIWNTLTTAFENKKIKRADLGLDKISAEFVENPSRTAKGVDKLFKLTGLDKIDSFGKETLVNAMVKKFKQMSEESLRQYIEPIMEQETTQTIQDIKNGELSDNVLYLVFSELSDVQPISLSELPAFYNTSGNLRILYMLKSFMIKRIDIFRNECFDKLRSKSKEARIQGMQNLFRLALLMIFCGVSKDWLINMLYGRKMDIPEVVVNNALGLVGFSKFHAYQLRDKGAGEVIKDFLMPPMFAPYDDLLGDIWRIGKGKRDLKDAESFKGIPLVGRFYYWHIGRGREKMKKRNKSKLK